MKYLISAVTLLLLAGTVCAQGHQAALSWTASPTTGVTGYNVYRLAGVCPTNPTLPAFGPKLATTTGLSYADTTVTAGTTYCYVVTAFTAGGESGFAATLQATAPVITAVTTVEPPGIPSLVIQ